MPDGLVLDRHCESSASFSPCRRYRYMLTRLWDSLPLGPIYTFLLHNPSTADEVEDDPTVSRCISFAKRWGGSGLIVVNRFAFRSTDPNALWDVEDPVGPENDRAIEQAARLAQETGGKLIVAWGAPGKKNRETARRLKERNERIFTYLRGWEIPLHVLRLSKSGNPWHPLYLPGCLKPIPWQP